MEKTLVADFLRNKCLTLLELKFVDNKEMPSQTNIKSCSEQIVHLRFL